MELLQEIKNKLGSMYIALSLFTIFEIFINGLAVHDIIILITYIGLFIILQTKLVKINIQCILSIPAGILYLWKNTDIMIILAIWLIIYSLIALKRLKINKNIKL